VSHVKTRTESAGHFIRLRLAVNWPGADRAGSFARVHREVGGESAESVSAVMRMPPRARLALPLGVVDRVLPIVGCRRCVQRRGFNCVILLPRRRVTWLVLARDGKALLAEASWPTRAPFGCAKAHSGIPVSQRNVLAAPSGARFVNGLVGLVRSLGGAVFEQAVLHAAARSLYLASPDRGRRSIEEKFIVVVYALKHKVLSQEWLGSHRVCSLILSAIVYLSTRAPA